MAMRTGGGGGAAASEEHIGQVGGETAIVADTPTITAGAYAAKDAVGGRLEFANAVRATPLSGVLHAVTIIDDGDQSAELVLILFDQAFTATGDNAAFDPSDVDLENCIGIVRIETTDYQSFNDNCVATVAGIGLPIDLTTTTLYGQLMCVAAPTYNSTSDLTVKVHILQD
jgi:hypothetical protein